MKKLHLVGAVFALFLCASASTNAAYVQGDSDFMGNIVTDTGSLQLRTALDVSYVSMNPVWLHLSSNSSLQVSGDQLRLNILNETSIPWYDFHFELNNAIVVPNSFSISPDTGSISDVVEGPDMLWLDFNPPELLGFTPVEFTIQYDSGTDYWLHMYPTTVVPIPAPATAWLIGSGLLGLIGVVKKESTHLGSA